MNKVYVIEENVDYEGDTLRSIHATRLGALGELDRRHAELAKLGTEHLGDMQLERDKNGVRVKSAYFRFRDGGFYMSEKELKE
jgi:hypothetical protein